MSEAEKNKGSNTLPFLLALAILLCGAAAYLAWLERKDQPPTSADARLLFNGEIIASFIGPKAGEIKEGWAAIATISGYGNRLFPGSVSIVHSEPNGEVMTMIRLREQPEGIHPPVPCQVTVIPPAAIN